MKVEIIYPFVDKIVSVNPRIQFGLPVVTGTRTPTRALYSLYKGGETVEFIAILYQITTAQVKAAIKYEKLPAGTKHKYSENGLKQAKKLHGIKD